MARPQLYGVGTKAQFRRAVPKSYSYRYEVASAAGPDGAPDVRSIIETRYRGRAASWTLARSMISEEKWTLNGSFLTPSPENPLVYPDTQPPQGTTIEAPDPEVTKAAQRALLARAAAAAAAANAPKPPAADPAPAEPVPPPAPKPKAPPLTRAVQRADPAEAPAAAPAPERIFSFGRKFVAPTSSNPPND